jgi:hypothetical protein
MAQVIVKFVDDESIGEFYFPPIQTELVKDLLADSKYRIAAEYYSPLDGEAAAEQAFDISNNPSREDDRLRHFHRQRSLSVGDLVVVDGITFLCASRGWQEIK